MGELTDALAAALDGPDAESHYECTHCGTVAARGATTARDVAEL